MNRLPVARVRLELDENLPADRKDELTRRGHDVRTVFDERLGGRKDPVVVRAATDENRMVITLDRAVSDIRNFPRGSHARVVVLRPVSQDSASIHGLVSRLLRAHDLARSAVVWWSSSVTRTRPTAKGPGVIRPFAPVRDLLVTIPGSANGWPR